MKRIICLALSLCCAVAFAQKAPKEVSLVVSADGASKAEAIDNALRIAIEQTFGTFVSANTEILNDQLVKDEIATVSSGNIQKYKEIAAVTLPNGNTSVTLNVTVSLKKLVKYAQSKGSECEFAGATFGANARLYEFNKRNEQIAIQNMIKQLDALRPLYDYKLDVKEPVLNKDGKSAKISFTVEAVNNDHTKMAYNIIENTFNSLALTPEQVKPLQDAGFSFHEYWLYFGKWEEKISPDRGRLIYLYNQIPEEICDFMLSSFCDFKISDNNGGIFFCEIKTSCRKTSFGNHIEDCFTGNRYVRSANISTSLFDLYKSGYISFLGYKKNGIVLFTNNYTLVSKEFSCDVLIENLNKINKIKIEPTKTSPSTSLVEGGRSTGSTTMPQTIWCSYRIIKE